jgi:tetratricopeptide (TPR) repeat protein
MYSGRSIMNYVFLLVIFFLTINVNAQDFKKQFKQAKDYFADGNYSKAMDAFRPLTIYDRDNPYPEYASYYYALSAQRLGFNTIAKEMFLQIKTIYPQWDQLDEVNFWLFKIYLDQREYFHALALAKQIKNNSLQNDINLMKRSALSKVDDVETLKMLVEENPQDYEAIRALGFALGKQTNPSDTLMLDSLARLLSWNKKDFIAIKDPPVFKSKYRVALLMPFRYSTLDPGPGKKKSQFALDMYQGMKLAADSLAAEGTKLELLAYDTDHDAETIKNLLKEEELKSTDLMVGPLFAEDAKAVHEFSQTNKINLVVNPISFNLDLTGQNPYAFLFQPSHKTIGQKSAELVAAKVRNKKCFVFYGESPKDSVMAFGFIKEAKRQGLKVVYVEEVRGETSGKILDLLAKATDFDEWKNPTKFKLKRDSIGSIFVASEDPLIYTKVINSVETRGDSILVVGQESWLEDGSVDLAKFEKNKVLFASPNFASIVDKPYMAFRRNYMKLHGVIPSAYAQNGYEFIMVMGRAFKKYGVKFGSGLMNEGVDGSLAQGYRMLPTKDNERVALSMFHKGRLEAINKP